MHLTVSGFICLLCALLWRSVRQWSGQTLQPHHIIPKVSNPSASLQKQCSYGFVPSTITLSNISYLCSLWPLISQPIINTCVHYLGVLRATQCQRFFHLVLSPINLPQFMYHFSSVPTRFCSWMKHFAYAVHFFKRLHKKTQIQESLFVSSFCQTAAHSCLSAHLLYIPSFIHTFLTHTFLVRQTSPFSSFLGRFIRFSFSYSFSSHLFLLTDFSYKQVICSVQILIFSGSLQ